MIFLQFAPVGTRAHIISFRPGTRYQLYQIVVSHFILGKHHQVIATLVGFSFLFIHRAACHIHFTAYNRFEDTAFSLFQFRFTFSNPFLSIGTIFLFLQQCQLFFQVFDFTINGTILLVHVITELLNGKHASMIGHRYPLHTVGNRLVNQRTDTGLTIEK